MTQFNLIICVKCFCVILLIINGLTMPPAMACGPGRSGGRRRLPRKTTPLVLEQHIPNVSENTLSASGPGEGKINIKDPRFRKLVPNYNPDIVFKDEEGTGVDRIMTLRLKEKLDTLAALVRNQWPGIKLRVIEAWDDANQFNYDSLHYEGRAADITTSDKDNSKYGVLARLAVIAGFDWVLYESRHHVHVSVKSDKAAASSRPEGCFTGDSLVYTPNGPVALSTIDVGQQILTVNSDGDIVFSEILLFLDRDPSVERIYVHLTTETGKVITLTQSHLIFTYDPIVSSSVTRTSSNQINTTSSSSSSLSPSSYNSTIPPIPSPSTWTASSSTDPSGQWTAIFARYIEPGMFVSTIPVKNEKEKENQQQLSESDYHQQLNLDDYYLKPEKVVKVTQSLRKGAYAPLTRNGNLIVNQIVASCYAVVNDQSLAHLSFLPVRLYYNLIESLNYIRKWLTLRLPSSSSSSSTTTSILSSSSSSSSFPSKKSSKSSIILSQPKLEINQDNQQLSYKVNDINDNNSIRYKKKIKSQSKSNCNLNYGIHWYPKLLYSIAKYVISSDYMYS
ncbi:indian hedgehog B protein-like [Panonychus citri]|uniref:indian hedgehog B protein-like n=1 Tax=Panonychus citri TaxID=50023 RepID=UPI00230755C7|nr:indian hedgehog B protein-like [Panonychus citri]